MEATKSAISEVMPEMSDKIKVSILETINKAVHGGIKQMQTEVERMSVKKLKELNEDVK